MVARWKDFQMPKSIVCDENTLTNTYGKFVAEPFERGYGITIGNTLRRVLLSSIEGAAITSVKIEGALHEFSTVEGVVEDVAQIILNLKKVVLKLHGSAQKKIYLKASKDSEVTAADLIVDETVEVMNPDAHIATLAKNGKLNMELAVGKGRGYVTAERLSNAESKSIGEINIDSIFTPVTKVNFNVENARVGQITDYDRLILEIWTNGSISPKDALLHSANIAQRHLDIFMKFGHIEEEDIEEEKSEVDQELMGKLKMNVSELDLSVRSANCLKEARLKTVGEVVRRTELEMLKYRNFGKKSLAEINVILQSMGLSFGMKVDDLLKK
ncbi:MAG: DNA-directed RNA polymerase subunit alpha [Candidatus Omnitrophota bacterium]